MLDEAQNVGSGLSLVAEMAARLRARNRWMVSGTPLSSGGLADIQALLRVLHHDPYADASVWRALIQGPFQRGKRSKAELGGRAHLRHGVTFLF